MAYQYSDHTTKYELTTDALRATANQRSFLDALRSFVTPIESAINDGVNVIGGWINQYILGINARRRDEQGYMLSSDSAGYNQENNMLFIILIVVFIVALIYLGRAKK